jgi:hypothetical protein
MMDRFKVIYTIKRIDKGGLLTDRVVHFDSFIEAVMFVRSLANTSTHHVIGKPMLERS